MKKLAIFMVPLFLFGENFTQIQKEITNSILYKIEQKKVKIYEQKLKSIQAKNYGSIDLNYNFLHYFNQPIMKTTTPEPVAVVGNRLIYADIYSETPISDKNNFIGEIKYSYPIFTGFAISSLIQKSKLEIIKQKLKLKNLKRELILQAAKLYSDIYALRAKQEALLQAKKTLISAKEKAKVLFQEGLINSSQIDEIDAKYYEILAKIQTTKSQKNSLLNLLSYLLNKKINSISGIILKKQKFVLNLSKRADLQAIKQTLLISKKEIKLAKSGFYPQIGFEVGIKKQATNFNLDKNDYQNIDKSYIGIGIKYNIFDGGATKANIEMAKISKLATIMFYQNYKNKIKTEFNNDLDNYKSLKFRLKSAQKEIKARKVYYQYIKEKFKEGLADVTDLNSAISKLATAKAKKEAIKAQLFFLSIKLKLNS